MADEQTNEDRRVTRPWRAKFERDHRECRTAFTQLLDAGCSEETLVWLLINLQCSIGRTKRSRGELKDLAKKMGKWALVIERLGQTDVSGILNAINVQFQVSCESCNATWVQGRRLSLVLRDAAGALEKQAPEIPRSWNVWESRTVTLLEDYVREKTGGELTNAQEQALDTLASAVLGKRTPVRVRAHRFRKATGKKHVRAR